MASMQLNMHLLQTVICIHFQAIQNSIGQIQADANCHSCMKGNEANANLHRLGMGPSIWLFKESVLEGLLR